MSLIFVLYTYFFPLYLNLLCKYLYPKNGQFRKKLTNFIKEIGLFEDLSEKDFSKRFLPFKIHNFISKKKFTSPH
jgi:hypothetical protein